MKLLHIAALLIVFAAPVAWSHPHEDGVELAELRKQLDALRAEVAQLRLENQQLKRQLAKEQGIDDVREPEPEPVEEKSKRVYRDADQIMRSLPQHLAPKKEGWTKTQVPSVKDWLSETMSGSQYTARKKIAGVDISRKISGDWEVELTFEAAPMRYMSWSMEERLSQVRLTGDAKFAEEAGRKYKAGRRVQVSGTIKKIGWDLIVSHPVGGRWHPTFVSIHLDSPTMR